MSTLKTQKYDNQFFDALHDGALNSARAVVPTLLEMLHPTSVVDFGCGQGAWLKAFRENGVREIQGLDGPYVDRSRLLIDESEFVPANLVKPVRLGRKFDLAICLEVAEHLPIRASRVIVESLVSASPIVLFSAAIPGQGGTDHVNEQWPEFWEKLFKTFGYRKVDVLRPKIWSDDRVEIWYRQNLFLYVDGRTKIDDDLVENSLSSSQTLMPRTEYISEHVLSQFKSFRGLFRATCAAALRAARTRFSASLHRE